MKFTCSQNEVNIGEFEILGHHVLLLAQIKSPIELNRRGAPRLNTIKRQVLLQLVEH